MDQPIKQQKSQTLVPYLYLSLVDQSQRNIQSV